MANFLFKLMRPAIKNGLMTLFQNHRDKITMTRAGLYEVKDELKDILDEIVDDIIRKENL
jgi:hypothetical protein